MKELVIMAGLPGSGKSTYVREHYKSGLVYHIDSDETRREMFGSYLTFPDNMYKIYDQMIKEGTAFYKAHKDESFVLIMDSTFLNNFRRNYYLDRLPRFDKRTIVMFHTKDLARNLENNKKRIKEKWVPEEVIRRMVDEYEPLDEETRARFDEVVDVDC